MKTSNRNALVGVLVACAGAVGALAVEHALADGAPTSPGSIFYSGTLVSASSGAPVTATPTITVRLFDREGMTGAIEHCAVTETVGVVDGSFRIALDPPGYTACVDALHAHRDVWVEVQVGSERMQRTKLGAVPYALEADTAQRLGTSDCPVGYARDTAASGVIACTRGADEVVRVGEGSSAFWVDRYEASVWTARDGAGDQRGASAADYGPAFPVSGAWTTPLYAASVSGVAPSRNLTWFQASEACRASGKRLPRGDEWLAAARGTPDGAGCQVASSSVRPTGGATSCQSTAGAQDLIGNLWEWTADWESSANTADNFSAAAAWGPAFGNDGTNAVTSFAQGATDRVQGLPSAVLRGGAAGISGSGVFAYNLNLGPSNAQAKVGFRCVIDR